MVASGTRAAAPIRFIRTSFTRIGVEDVEQVSSATVTIFFMPTPPPVVPEDLRMPADEFDRVMRQAITVPPQPTKKDDVPKGKRGRPKKQG